LYFDFREDLHQRFKDPKRPDGLSSGRTPTIASEQGTLFVRLDLLQKHLKSRAHRDAHAWAFPHDRIQAPSVADSDVGKLIASPELANRRQFVAYFRLICKIVLMNVCRYRFVTRHGCQDSIFVSSSFVLSDLLISDPSLPFQGAFGHHFRNASSTWQS